MNRIQTVAFLSIFSAVLFGPGVASADELKCDVFQARLEQQIHRAGDKVAPPRWVKSKATTGFGVYVDFEGIQGLSGSLQCAPGGRFFRLQIDAAIESEDAVENARRISRAENFEAAAICAVEPASPAQCTQIAVKRLFDKAYAKFLASKRRGDEFKFSTRRVSSDKSRADASINIDQGAISYFVDQSDADKPIQDITR